MPLTAHDAEEATRHLEGRVYDADEKVSHFLELWKDPAFHTPSTAQSLIDAQNELANRQRDLLAALREQVRRAVS